MTAMPLHGHLWTIRPWLLHQLRPERGPASTPWTTVLTDPRIGDVRLRGKLSARPNSRALVLIVHGLGGSSDAQYVVEAARAAERAGFASLRLDLRGASGDGEDVYNAGLTADLRAALASPALSVHQTIYILGYSLGGHLTLRYATEAMDPRVLAVAAICPPVDLARSAEAMDRPRRWVYRRNVLEGLKAGYAAVVARQRQRGLPSEAEARTISHLREWDERIVAPRFGFRSAAHYYAESSVAPRLSRLAGPALFVAATDDPMIPADTVRPAVDRGHPHLDVHWLRDAGHVGFPRSVDLGLGGETGLPPQVMRWFQRAREARLHHAPKASGSQ